MCPQVVQRLKWNRHPPVARHSTHPVPDGGMDALKASVTATVNFFQTGLASWFRGLGLPGGQGRAGKQVAVGGDVLLNRLRGGARSPVRRRR
jgi:hypothetical protein